MFLFLGRKYLFFKEFYCTKDHDNHKNSPFLFFGQIKKMHICKKGIVYDTSTMPDNEQQRCLTK